MKSQTPTPPKVMPRWVQFRRSAESVPYWTPNHFMWPGESVFLIGGGPSLKGFDFGPLIGLPVIGINDAFKLGPWITMCLFGDNPWYETHREELRSFGGIKVSIASKAPLLEDNILWLNRQPEGMPGRCGRIGWNYSTGAAAIHLAIVCGAARVFLLGFDMKLGAAGEMNWHPNLVDSPDPDRFNQFLKGFQLVKRDLEKFPGVEVINLGPDSALEIFPKMTLQEAVKK